MARSVSWLDGDKSEPKLPAVDIGSRVFVFESDDEKLDHEIAVLPSRRSAIEDEAPIVLRPIQKSQGLPNQNVEDTDEHEPVIDVHDTGKNTTINLSIDVQIDVTEDVAQLSRLNRLGWFNRGVTLYEEKLKHHLDCFPVAVEYADLLLQQGEYKKALSFTEDCCALHGRTGSYAPDEHMVLKSMNAYAAIFAKGTVDDAVKALKGMSDYLKKEKAESLKATKIHMVELYFQISIFINDNILPDSLPDDVDFGSIAFRDHPWFFLPLKYSSCFVIGKWYYLLRQQGFHWESFRFLRLVLAILKTNDSPFGHLEYFLQISVRDLVLEETFLTLAHITSSGDEQQILAELASISSIRSLIIDTTSDLYLDSAKTCWHQEKSLARLIVESHPHLSTSRPFLEWIMKEHVHIFPFQSQLTARLRGDLPNMIPQRRHSIKPLLDRLLDFGAMRNTQRMGHVETAQKVLKCAEENGDTLLQRTVLQELIMFDDSTVTSRLQNLMTLASLLDTVDLVGYIDYLVLRYTTLQEISPNMQAVERSKLCEEIRRFNLRYPWDTAFSLPLSEYIKDRIYIRVLTDLHRDSECVSTQRILNDLKWQLPSYLEPERTFWLSGDRRFGASDMLHVLHMQEETDARRSRRYRPSTFDDRVTILPPPRGFKDTVVRDIATDEESLYSPVRIITREPKYLKSGVSQSRKSEEEKEAGEEAGKEEEDQNKNSKQLIVTPRRSSNTPPPESHMQIPSSSSSSESEGDDNKKPDESTSVQIQDMHHDTAEPPNDAMMSGSNLHRQPTIELGSDDSENKKSGRLATKEQGD